MSLRRPAQNGTAHSQTEMTAKSSAPKARMIGRRRLLFFHEIPSWQQDNEYILSGYRPTSNSAYVSLCSVGHLHNQTINIYSHLLGSVAFFLLPYYFYTNYVSSAAQAVPTDLVVVSVYSIGVAICFAFSTTFHILWNHSPKLTSFCNRLDYLGILILMWGAGIPTIYYGFICNPTLQRLYWAMTTTTATGCAVVTMNPVFMTSQFRPWRASFYAGFGLSSIIFVLHGLHLHGWEMQKARMSLVYMLWMATSNLTGAILYAARIPEKWSPYTFDIYGASHQFLHIFVLIAAIIHFYGLIQSFTLIRSIPYICNV